MVSLSDFHLCSFPISITSRGEDQSGSSSKIVHAQKIEPLTLSELNQFIITAESQVGLGYVDWVIYILEYLLTCAVFK